MMPWALPMTVVQGRGTRSGHWYYRWSGVIVEHEIELAGLLTGAGELEPDRMAAHIGASLQLAAQRRDSVPGSHREFD